ncbi:MAG: DNA cytosine methyltransferase [Candidatus Bathyarchaeia archaeon]
MILLKERNKLAIFGFDFFCGVGGATKGFQNAGMKIVKGIDLDKTCTEAYEKNCYPSKFIMEDINVLNTEKIISDMHLTSKDFLVCIGCAPCQPFSRFKRENENDKRRKLILAFANAIKVAKPHVIFVENVPGFEKAQKGNIFKEFLETLDLTQMNYQYEWKIVNAKNYGVPQNRRRFVLLASRIGKIPLPNATHGKNLLPYVTVRDRISKYALLAAGEVNKDFPNHVARRLSDLNLTRMKLTPINGGSRTEWPKEFWLDCHKKNAGHTDVYGRMRWDKPAPTLTCKCNSFSNGRFGHPEQNRAISLREAAQLQSFPDDFIFYGGQTDIARQIGNAVPPLMAEAFGKTIVKFIESHRIANAP